MRRQLSAREVILIGLLLVLVSVGGYLYLFYFPMTSELERLESETALYEEQINLEKVRVDEKQKMERELEEIFASNPNPLSLAQFDNVKPLMVELNSILQATQQYTVTFGTVDATKDIVRRQVLLSFSASSYETAKQIFIALHDSEYRCMLNDVNVSLGEGTGPVSVSASLLYFEYQTAEQLQKALSEAEAANPAPEQPAASESQESQGSLRDELE